MGSRGSEYETEGFKHGGGGGSGKGGEKHFPVEANVRIKNKTTEGALQEFRDKHVAADHEYLYIIDDQGYVHEYDEGTASEVTFNPYNAKDARVIHNHPSHGEPAFSFEDLDNFASGKQKSVTASSKNYDYTVERGTHFKEKEFRQALKTAKIKGHDYSDGVHNWLKDNAGKYGYKYTRTTYDDNGNAKRTYKSSTKPKGWKGSNKK